MRTRATVLSHSLLGSIPARTRPRPTVRLARRLCMNSGGLKRRGLLALALCCAMLSSAGLTQAASFSEFVDPNPSPGNQFGATVVALSTGNVVVTSPFDDAGGADAGAVYLFNGSTGALISTLRGSTDGDNLGSTGVTALSSGNYVIGSVNWDNGAIVDAGAA